MPFIKSSEIEYLKDQLLTDPSRLGKIYKAKKNNYTLITVEHDRTKSMLGGGWEEYGVPLKTKTKLRKLKDHVTKFQDDIWCQLYELGYRRLSYADDITLPYGKDVLDKKKISIIAVNDDTILLVECRSRKRHTKAPSFKKQFKDLPLILKGLYKTLDQMFGKGRKVKFVFATRNLKLDRQSSDIKLLISSGSFFYNDNTYEYVKGLIKSYKNAAHYQFLALLFKGQLISRQRVEVPAIEGTMGGKVYYMFSIEPHLLLKMGFILHRTKANESEMPTYQRLLVPSRLKGISKFIQDGGYFPNSIILNFSKKKNKLQFEGSSRAGVSRSRFGTLKIPNAYAIAYIIDGQHRVYGYAQSDYKESNTIPVVAFQDLTSTEQLEIFMDINENQKAVSPTLRITLEEDLYWNSDRIDSRMKALRSSIIQALGANLNSPLYKKISIGEDRALLSANPFASALLRSGLLPIARGNKYRDESIKGCIYDIENHDHDSEMNKSRDKITKFISLCYHFVEEFHIEIFERDRYFIVSNRGTYAFISLLGSLNNFETDRNNLNSTSSSGRRFNVIKKYLDALLKGIKSLSVDDENYLLGSLGSGSQNVWLRNFQNLINQEFSEYEPSELIDWKERQDQNLQDAGRKLGTEIEQHVKRTVIANLKILFRENWDIEIGSIQRACEARAAEEVEKLYKEGLGRKKIPWTDMFFINDYKTIIEKYWARVPDNGVVAFKSFEQCFAIDAGYGFNSKSEKIKWLSVFNSYRNNWAHEGTKEKGLNKLEVDFLKDIHQHLCG